MGPPFYVVIRAIMLPLRHVQLHTFVSDGVVVVVVVNYKLASLVRGVNGALWRVDNGILGGSPRCIQVMDILKGLWEGFVECLW